MKRLLVVFALALVIGGCGSEENTPAPTPNLKTKTASPTAPVTHPPATATSESSPTSIMAQVRVVNLITGTALPNMKPIATTEPNAFDSPVATGNDTDTAGNSTIRVPYDQHLYLRAWDPGLNYFPNNFYEVLPGGGSITDNLVIEMVPAASLSAQFLLPGDQLAADATIGLMLFHPTRGPWWPTEGTCDSEGVVVFDHLPAGEYVLRFKSESGARLEYSQTALPPEGRVDLGILTLQ